MQGVATEDILGAADWSTESSFQWFYYKPVHNTTFAKSVLTATNNTIDMWDWAFWIIIVRMAKTVKRLNAIQDYIKTVKSSISMVPPTPYSSIDMLYVA